MHEIWAEGYVVTGNIGHAQLVGTARGRTFQEACENYAAGHPEFAKYFDAERLTHWGCRLFNNEADARRTFG